MVEPEKPFACTLPDCGMTFTNEDHLHVHTKKHDMVLQLGIEQKAAFVADQTPTPTRFIRNCEEVGLFQDLQNVNPFDEGFKRAIEAKPCLLSLDGTISSTSDDVLHTPQMVFPLMDTSESALFTSNNHRNITISRSSSDESGAVKEYETTTISKLTNEVTTISRIVGKQDFHDKILAADDRSIIKHEELAQNKDVVNETSVSYTTNNVIKIHSNVEIRKDGSFVNIDTSKNVPVTLIYTDSVIKDETSVVTKDVLLTDSNKLQVPELKVPPIMSQKSLDFVVDSLTSECSEPTHDKEKDLQVAKVVTLVNNDGKSVKVKNDSDRKEADDYEVIIKLPNGTQVRMKAVDETKPDKSIVNNETKEKLKKVLSDKADKKSQMDAVIQRIPLENAQIIQNILPVQTGAIIPLAIMNPINNPILVANNVQKIPITPLNLYTSGRNPRKTVKRRITKKIATEEANTTSQNDVDLQSLTRSARTDSSESEDTSRLKNGQEKSLLKRPYEKSETGSGKVMDSRCAASKRYRERLKITMKQQSDENQQLKERNQRLMAENAALKMMITEHLKSCPNSDDLRITELNIE